MKNPSCTMNLRLAAGLLLMMTAALEPVRSAEVDDNNISFTLNFPSEVRAGDSFTVTGTLLNTGDKPELINASWIIRKNSVSGSHASSYRVLLTPLHHTVFSRILLDPGVPQTITASEFYYEAEHLFDGEIIFNSSIVTTSNTAWERTSIELEPFSIKVIHAGQPTVTLARLVPKKFPLETRAISHSNHRRVVYDPNTGYEWLPLTATLSQSLISTLDKLAPGEEFEGFRIAALEDVRTLFLNAIYAAGIDFPDYALFAVQKYEADNQEKNSQLRHVIQKLQEQLGITRTVSMDTQELLTTSGLLLGTSEIPDAVLYASISIDLQSAQGGFFTGTAEEFAVRAGSNDAGVWLLRESER